MGSFSQVFFVSCFLLAFGATQLMAQKPAISFSYTVQPQKFSLQDREMVKIMLNVRNETAETIDPETHLLKLMVNGEQSIAFMLTIGNGVREAKWYQLPAGGQLSRDLSVLAKAIFPKAGEYRMQLVWKEFATEEVWVEVME